MRKPNTEAVSKEDMDFIRLMAAMPTEAKILTRGLILGLGVSEKIQKGGNPETARPSA